MKDATPVALLIRLNRTTVLPVPGQGFVRFDLEAPGASRRIADLQHSGRDWRDGARMTIRLEVDAREPGGYADWLGLAFALEGGGGPRAGHRLRRR